MYQYYIKVEFTIIYIYLHVFINVICIYYKHVKLLVLPLNVKAKRQCGLMPLTYSKPLGGKAK